MMKKGPLVLGAILVTGLIICGVVGYAIVEVFRQPVGFASVAILILVGLAAFIGIMNVISVSAYYIGISDKEQPFGLPDGTVRAILTIAFIVLVGVLSSYLLTSTGTRAQYGETISLRGIAAKDVDALVQRLDTDGLASIERRDANTADVAFHPKVDFRLADDVSKQVLTMLSTILAAMIGFYFGAQPPSTGGGTANPDERADIDKELSGLAARAQALRNDAAAKRATVDAPRQQAIDAVLADLTPIEQHITAAQARVRDLTHPLDVVRAAHKVAKSAADGLATLRTRLQAV